MKVFLRKFEDKDLKAMMEIWNEIVREGNAFPQEEELDLESAKQFFSSQTATVIAEDDNRKIVGLYILHPNNVGRCGHIANSSYAVTSAHRGEHIGEQLVRHSLEEAKRNGFSLLQFNAVVDSNKVARQLYKRLGFRELGVIPRGFRLKNGEYEDIYPHIFDLETLEEN